MDIYLVEAGTIKGMNVLDHVLLVVDVMLLWGSFVSTDI